MVSHPKCLFHLFPPSQLPKKWLRKSLWNFIGATDARINPPHKQNQTTSSVMRLYRWSFRIRFGYLMMTKLRWFCVYFYHTQNTLVILQSLSLYAMRSPLRPSIHPSSFLLFWSRTPHPVLFFGFSPFYNPLHISARASAHTHTAVSVYNCAQLSGQQQQPA